MIRKPCRAKLPVERVDLYRPEHEWTYSHHASITFYKGRFYAIWSNGREHEDYPGQRVLIASAATSTIGRRRSRWSGRCKATIPSWCSLRLASTNTRAR